MKLLKFLSFAFLMVSFATTAQDQNKDAEPKAEEHYNTNKFRQLYQEFSTPNQYRSASGAPGPAYYQQRADYKMDIRLDDENHHIYGSETITYTNNSPDVLDYLWVQLDQNIREKNPKNSLIEPSRVPAFTNTYNFTKTFLKESFDGGFNVTKVTDTKGNKLTTMINQTMMRVELPKPLKTGEKFSFNIVWDYNINNHVEDGGRSGYEQFPDGHRTYVIAQFYPRMCVYNDVEGWQNSQFWGRDEFALPFGTFEVNITVPADHWLDGTGTLLNMKNVYSDAEMQRYELAKKTYDKPVVIRTQQEAEQLAKQAGEKQKTKTWQLKADYVRDFGWTSSRRYVADAMAVKIGDKDVMAISIYPPEGNPLWEQWSTRAVAQTLKSYSRMTFDYPYEKAISVHADQQGMEYPMICWNYGRPEPDGTYSDRVKFGMISVIIHEVGHNYFPMIVNSDERQWTWMDEGLNTFVQYVAEQDFGETHPDAIKGLDKYPSRRGPAANITSYMGGDQRYLSPIMSKGLNVYQFGANAYAKPGTALNILRETVMGRELFDYAFRTYANRWMFKHPTPEDFFRTMEDASAMDLDWFWRGWFYTTQYNDMGIKSVDRFYATSVRNKEMKEYMTRNNIAEDRVSPTLVYMVKEDSEDFKPAMKGSVPTEVVGSLNEYLSENFTEAERKALKAPKFFYQITVEKPGGLVMPVILEYTYADGTTETVTHPAEIWRLNDKEITLSKATEKEVVGIVIDPKLETADIDVSNNSWPKTPKVDKFEQMKK